MSCFFGHKMVLNNVNYTFPELRYVKDYGILKIGECTILLCRTAIEIIWRQAYTAQ